MADQVGQLMKGAIYFHVHTAPDAGHERRLDALELALQAKEAGMKAVVIKCHEFGTAPVAYIVNKAVPDFLVFGSLALNSMAGGLNPEGVEIAAKMGGKVVLLPRLSSVCDT